MKKEGKRQKRKEGIQNGRRKEKDIKGKKEYKREEAKKKKRKKRRIQK